jgi:hypothetical protein
VARYATTHRTTKPVRRADSAGNRHAS